MLVSLLTAWVVFSSVISVCSQSLPRTQARIEVGSFATEFPGSNVNQLRFAASTSAASTDSQRTFGRMLFGAYTMFVNWVNIEKGGIIINGTNYSVSIHFVEDYSSQAYVTEAYETLAPDYDFFFGPYSSSLTRKAVEVTESQQKLLMAGAASEQRIFSSSKYTFGTLPYSPQFVESAFSTFSALGAKKIGIISDLDYASCRNTTLSQKFSVTYNISLFRHVLVDRSDSNYSAVVRETLREFQSNGVDVVHACTYSTLCYEVRLFE
jgi:hypothetical protein